MKRLPYLIILVMLAFVACTATQDVEQAKQVVTIDNLKKHVEYLSSDLCEGRKPFSKGAERAVDYLAELFLKEYGFSCHQYRQIQ